MTTQSGLFAEHSATRSPTLDAELRRARRDRHAPRASCSPNVSRSAGRRPARRSRRRRAPRSAPSARAASACAACRPASRRPSTSSRDDLERPPGPGELRENGIGFVTAAKTTTLARRPAASLLHDVERPQLAAGADRSALGVAARGPAGTPGCSASSRSPPAMRQRVYTRNTSRSSVGPQQLERFEAGHLRHLAGAVREPLDELVGALGGNGDGVDLHDTHVRPPGSREPHSRGRVSDADARRTDRRGGTRQPSSPSDCERRNCSISATRSSVGALLALVDLVDDGLHVGPGREAGFDPARGTPGCVRRARGDRDRGCTPRPAGRAARGPRAATASPTRTAAPAPRARAGNAGVAERALHDGLQAGRARVVGAQRHELLRERALRRRRVHRPRPCGATRATGIPPSVTRLPHAEPARAASTTADATVGPAQRRLRPVHEHDVAPGPRGRRTRRTRT